MIILKKAKQKYQKSCYFFSNSNMPGSFSNQTYLARNHREHVGKNVSREGGKHVLSIDTLVHDPGRETRPAYLLRDR